jgi:nucleoside phosphorylase
MASIAGSLERYQRRVGDALLQRSYERISAELGRFASGVRIGLVTALQLETDSLLAVARELGCTRPPIPRSALDVTAFYYPVEFRVSGSEEPLRGIICQCAEMGNNSAAIAATCILKDYQVVENLIIVGVAGGVPAAPTEFDALQSTGQINDHVRLGDAVISKDGIFQYDLVKRYSGERFEFRAVKKTVAPNLTFFCDQISRHILAFEEKVNLLVELVSPSLHVIRPNPGTDILQEFEFDSATDQFIPVRSFIHPPQLRRDVKTSMVHFGEIASANVLLKDPKLRDSLRLRSVRAIEMEGSGVADAAWTFHRGYIAIRGICDYCDPNKNDTWKPYAALVAAATVGCFILVMYSE